MKTENSGNSEIGKERGIELYIELIFSMKNKKI